MQVKTIFTHPHLKRAISAEELNPVPTTLLDALTVNVLVNPQTLEQYQFRLKSPTSGRLSLIRFDSYGRKPTGKQWRSDNYFYDEKIHYDPETRSMFRRMPSRQVRKMVLDRVRQVQAQAASPAA